VRRLIRDIRRAAGQPSQGIAELGGAVNDLDRMTQQSAALVQPSAAAASLRAQADRLAQVVGGFRLHQG
jgi:methyl-accepting chemotaxis protein